MIVRVRCAVNHRAPESTNEVERNQYGNNNDSDGDKYDQQGLQVAKKEIGVQSAFLDNLPIVELKQCVD